MNSGVCSNDGAAGPNEQVAYEVQALLDDRHQQRLARPLAGAFVYQDHVRSILLQERRHLRLLPNCRAR